jgi:small-conductance mechanosensitive channel
MDAIAAEKPSFVPRALGVMGPVLTLIAVVGPVLGLAGYVNAAEALMVPTALTLFIFGLLLALHAVSRDLYALAFRTSHEDAAEALVPVLVNFALFLVALPALAVIWGVRPERLADLYTRALEGFTVGATRITPGIIFAVIVIFGAGILITRLLQGALKSTILPRTSMDVGARNAVSAGVGYVGIGLSALIAVTTAGIDLTALGFVLGALSVGIGFGLQNVVSNFVSGIILLIERPISEGDWIEVNGNMGIVKDISVRSTRIETFDKTDLIVPNADFISGTVTNWTRGNTVGRVMLNVGVAYGTDTRRVAAILQEIAEAHPDVSSFPEPGVDFMGFGADSMDFRVRVILRDINLFGKVRTDINHSIAERFAEEGIEIPFAQRDIWLRNPEALVQATGHPQPAPPVPMTPTAEQPADAASDIPPSPVKDT